MSQDTAEHRPSPVLPDVRRLLQDPDLSDDGREQLGDLLRNPSKCRKIMEIVNGALNRLREELEDEDIECPIAQAQVILAGMAYHSDSVRLERESAYYLEEFMEQRADKRDEQEEQRRREAEAEQKRKRELEARKAKAALAKATDEQAAEVTVEKRKQPDAPEKPSSRSKRTRRVEVGPVALSPMKE